MEIVETLATTDGSPRMGRDRRSETPMLLALLSRKHFDNLYASTPDVIIAGASRLAGRRKRSTAAIASAGDGVSLADAGVLNFFSATAW